MKFAVTWDTLPAPDFVKIAQKMLKRPASIALPRGGDAYWFPVQSAVNLIFDFLTPKVDRFMPLPLGPLVPICSENNFTFVCKISYSYDW